MSRAARLAGLLVLLLALVATPAGPASAYDSPVEDFADYQPQTTCTTKAKVGTRYLARWLRNRFEGGPAVASVRPCTPGASEHKDGRAIDWTMNAARAGDRAEVRRFLDKVLAPNAQGEVAALARRMGLMYVIWNDRMYAAYDHFEPRPYRSSSCKGIKLSKCSPTLRHRDHVHLSLSRPGARARTSWYPDALTPNT